MATSEIVILDEIESSNPKIENVKSEYILGFKTPRLTKKQLIDSIESDDDFMSFKTLSSSKKTDLSTKKSKNYFEKVYDNINDEIEEIDYFSDSLIEEVISNSELKIKNSIPSPPSSKGVKSMVKSSEPPKFNNERKAKKETPQSSKVKKEFIDLEEDSEYLSPIDLIDDMNCTDLSKTLHNSSDKLEYTIDKIENDMAFIEQVPDRDVEIIVKEDNLNVDEVNTFDVSEFDDLEFLENNFNFDDIDLDEEATITNSETTENVYLESYREKDLELKLESLLMRKARISDEICDIELSNSSSANLKIEKLKEERIKVLGQIESLKKLQKTRKNQPQSSKRSSMELIHIDDDILSTVESSFSTRSYQSAFSESKDDLPLSSRTINQPPKPAPPKRIEFKHKWSREVAKALHQIFKMSEFRPKQLDAIDATLSGKNVFVLMPTGGGKSLCYQLPAVIQTGNTRGVTVVISPLLALMQDQVNHLVAWGIPSIALTGDLNAAQRNFAFDEISKRDPRLRLLYVTPEMLSKSDKMREAIDSLYNRKLLARFVVDEAHCVSQWGHDFRPDYVLIGNYKRQYPGIPFMALTATANMRVQSDIISNLNIKGCLTLSSSFNRPNLFYEIRKKSNDVISEISSFVLSRYHGKSGIIYCRSKANCEKVTEMLQTKSGISAGYYHAGLAKEDRQRIQLDWQENRISIIVATVAFGMGIDKPDVRFVIHHTFPDSIESYYQETGRAGRDGKPSTCVLFYSYRDKRTIEKFIEEGEGNKFHKERQTENLNRVIQFCENRTECRRKLVLSYFGENFDSNLCVKSCDNCLAKENRVVNLVDYTELSSNMIKLAKRILSTGRKVTLLYIVDVSRGSRAKKILEIGDNNLDLFGFCKNYKKDDLVELLRLLVTKKAFTEITETNFRGNLVTYLSLGPNSTKFENMLERITIEVASSMPSVEASQNESSGRDPALNRNDKNEILHGSTISKLQGFGFSDNSSFSEPSISEKATNKKSAYFSNDSDKGNPDF
ncbi:ATP-dependent DNA helicase hus2/rqh1 [Smittium culicis]|uniref:DNA 3'-5' helicase n=1 Tax=Smittium culicis TaxID=133412 RepID=A0A1R1YBU7_9FUNG|nr:ATP-dependent DNA helicase hus2/rqh1 [Smittium culicis]